MIRIFLILLCLATAGCASKRRIDDNTETALLHMKIGSAFLGQARYPAALRELLIAEKYAPNNALVLNNLGLAYYVQGQLPQATKKIRKAVEIDPKFSEARNNLARVLIDREQYAEAIRQLKIALNDLVYDKPEKSWTNLGLAYMKMKKYVKAKEAFLKAISISRIYCPAYTLYGRTLFEEKKYSEGAEALDRAVTACKKQRYDEPNYYGALCYLKIGQKQRAKAKMQEIVDHFPNGDFAAKAKSILKMMR